MGRLSEAGPDDEPSFALIAMLGTYPTPAEPRTDPQSGDRLAALGTWLRFRLAWLAGADMRTLQNVPDDKPFHDRLGALVFLATAGSGVAITYWASVSLGMPMSRIWWVGVVWFLFLLNLEPLLLDIVATSGRALVGALSLRVVLSLVIASLFAEPILIGVFNRPITNLLSKQDIAAIHTAEKSIATTYKKKIAVAQTDIRQIRNSETRLKNEIIDRTRERNCEIELQSCAESHQGLGCGPFCIQAEQQVAALRARLREARPGDRAAIATDEANIATWRQEMRAQIRARQRAILGSHDLLTREQALWRIGTRSGVAMFETWAVRVALLALDLMCLGLKCAHLRTSSYKLYAAAAQRREGVKALALDAETDVITERIKHQAEATKEADRARIDFDLNRRIADLDAQWEEWRVPRSQSRRESVFARPLDDYAGRSRAHESMPMDVPGALRRAGWIGAALVTAMAAVLILESARTGNVVPGEWVALIAVVVTVGLVSYTRGFAAAPAWAMRAIFAILLAGLALPIVLFVLNI